MRSGTIIILLFVVVFSGWLAATVFAQSASVQGPPPLGWHGIDVGRTLEISANLAVVAGASGAIVLAFLALRQIDVTRRASQAELTLRLFDDFQSDHMLAIIDYLRRHELMSADDKMDFAKVRSDPKAEMYFYTLANFFELIGHLVQSGMYSPELAERTFGPILRDHWKRCEPVVSGYRKLLESPDSWKAWERYVENM